MVFKNFYPTVSEIMFKLVLSYFANYCKISHVRGNTNLKNSVLISVLKLKNKIIITSKSHIDLFCGAYAFERENMYHCIILSRNNNEVVNQKQFKNNIRYCHITCVHRSKLAHLWSTNALKINEPYRNKFPRYEICTYFLKDTILHLIFIIFPCYPAS